MTQRIISILILLSWLFYPFYLSAQPQNSIEGDLQALTDLYHATDGDNWKDNSGWLEGYPSNSWYGIRVDRSGRVIQIRLQGNNLNGSLPASLGNLSRVAYFNVKQNHLKGEIPPEIGGMQNLVYLLLNGRINDPEPGKDHHPGKEAGTGTSDRSNNFTGPIPPSIGNLGSLQFFECTGKNVDAEGLSGPIPSEIGELTNLIGLHLDYNDLTEVPESLGNLTKLIHLGLGVNQLRGGIPSDIKKLKNLRYFRIGNNAIGGTIPDLSNLKDLRIFSSTFNNLTGPIPSALTDGTLPRMSTISLAHNNLSGTLSEFGANLTMFTVDNNNLEGTIPESLTSQARMINLGLGWNNFEGNIPDLSQMSQLRFIRVQDNNLTGPLPMVYTGNKRLQNIYYQNNNLSGYIDPALADMADLPNFRSINISNNRFSEADLKDFKEALRSKGKLNTLRYGSQNPKKGEEISESGENK